MSVDKKQWQCVAMNPCMYKNFQPELFPLSDNTNDLEFVLRSRLYIKKNPL